MTIRPLTPADAELWAALRFEALTSCPTAFSADTPADASTLVEVARERLRAGDDRVVLGAFDGTLLVGCAGLRRDEGTKLRHRGMLWGMYVTPSHRGRGVGSALVAAVVQQARTSIGMRVIYLAVSEDAPGARRMYERAGFVAWGTEPLAMMNEGRMIEETHMVLAL